MPTHTQYSLNTPTTDPGCIFHSARVGELKLIALTAGHAHTLSLSSPVLALICSYTSPSCIRLSGNPLNPLPPPSPPPPTTTPRQPSFLTLDVTAHHTTPHPTPPYHTTPHHTPHPTTPHHTTPHHTTPHLTPHLTTPHLTTPQHTTPHHTPHHTSPHHTTPHLTTPHHT